ncbi:hypothetical protein NVP1101O_009 [Vibrio phage 1.101.O._10N.261.45.C6]|nr:hypothetical protein NVP1101O_009 [Vibrio phage 1.101.O._10N.261.45.C6]
MEKKMKDVFNLPLKSCGYMVVSQPYIPCWSHKECIDTIECSSGEEAKSVTKAINSHDELVEKLELYKNYIEHYVLKELQPNNPVATIGKELLAMK